MIYSLTIKHNTGQQTMSNSTSTSSLPTTSVSVHSVYDQSLYRNPFNKTNSLLIRTPLGKSKPSIHNLPNNNHTYGRDMKYKPITSTAQCLTWDQTKTIHHKNKIINKAKKNININNNKNKENNNSNNHRSNNIDVNEIIHGKASEYSDNIADVINNTFQRLAIEQNKQKVAQQAQNISKNQKHQNAIKHTKATLMLNQTIQNNNNSNNNIKQRFIMKKFQNVEPRVQMPHIVQKHQYVNNNTQTLISQQEQSNEQQYDHNNYDNTLDEQQQELDQQTEAN